MSEILCCGWCGELSLYDRTVYLENKPICPECQKKEKEAVLKIEKN
ncbi:hypothetical protein P2R12_19150 [Cytobacillus oceanisediminis]|nr:hypothetical protein [Cytobacillus oceanisediminis]MDF2039048.1 hypothetical protein [Cytobacillus oceanisediminis]UOE56537.1 hypothetical protein IRB79_07370 [Cytobacillus oceanisediminis]